MKVKINQLGLLLTLFISPTIIQTMTLGQARDIRDEFITPAINDVEKNGVNVENLTKACKGIMTPGVKTYVNYLLEYFKPFVNTFGANPEKVCPLILSSEKKEMKIQEMLNAAIPTRGGTASSSNGKAALEAVQAYLANGGSPLLFLKDTNAVIASLVGSSSNGTNTETNKDANVLQIANNLQPLYKATLINNNTANLQAISQCSSDLAAFLANISSTSTPSSNLGSWATTLMNMIKNKSTTSSSNNTSAGKDPDVVNIAMTFIQPNDTYMGSDDTEVTNLSELYEKIHLLNNPNEDFKTPVSIFGQIDEQIATYNGDRTNEGFRFNQSESPSAWAERIVTALKDVNDAYSYMNMYANGDNAIPGFSYSGEDFLDTIIPDLVAAAQASGGGSTTSTAGSLELTDPNLVKIAQALSGINGEPNNKDQYFVMDSDNTVSVNPNKLNEMAEFAAALRNALNQWQGDSSDPASAAHPELRFEDQSFSSYITNMNSAVADETDILSSLPDLFTDLGKLDSINSPNLTYDIKETPSYNIYGKTTENGDTVLNENGLISVLFEKLGGSQEDNSSEPTLELNNADSIAYLAVALADQISNHNASINYVFGRCGAVKEIFIDSPATSTPVNFLNGHKYSVTGSPASSTTRFIAQEIFYDLVNNDNNGLLKLLNNQARSLQKQAKALITAGASQEQFKTTEGMAQTAIDYFSGTNISVGTTGAGAFDISKSSLTF